MAGGEAKRNGHRNVPSLVPANEAGGERRMGEWVEQTRQRLEGEARLAPSADLVVLDGCNLMSGQGDAGSVTIAAGRVWACPMNGEERNIDGGHS